MSGLGNAPVSLCVRKDSPVASPKLRGAAAQVGTITLRRASQFNHLRGRTEAGILSGASLPAGNDGIFNVLLITKGALAECAVHKRSR
jgi:hypothetical protein